MFERESPYTADEERVCEYIRQITANAVGCGDDPIGFLIASHAELRRRLENLGTAGRAVMVWADGLQPYSDAGTELVPVFKNLREQLEEAGVGQ